MFRNIEEIRNFLPSMSRIIATDTLGRITEGLPRLAVMPFARDPNVWLSPHESDTLAQILAIEILNTRRYAVLPRTSTIRDALDERDFQMLGYTDDEGLARLSVALNADLVLSGATQGLGAINMFTAQILRLRDGSVAYAAPARDFRFIDDAMHLMEEIAVFLTDPERGHEIAAARIAREMDAAARMAADAEAIRIQAAADAAARREWEAAEALRLQREAARAARRASGSRNALELLSAHYFWEGGEYVGDNPRTGVSVGILLSGLYFSPVPYISFGFEARMHLLLDDYLDWDEFGESSLFFSVAPTLGLVVPLGHGARVFSNALLELGNFGSVDLNGIFGTAIPWVTPGFNVGLEFGRQFGFSIKYRHTWFYDRHTHAIGLGINLRF